VSNARGPLNINTTASALVSGQGTDTERIDALRTSMHLVHYHVLEIKAQISNPDMSKMLQA
jgi:hypothetical protein